MNCYRAGAASAVALLAGMLPVPAFAGQAQPAAQQAVASGQVERAPAPTRRAMQALRIDDTEKIELDGRLDEPDWKRAPRVEPLASTWIG